MFLMQFDGILLAIGSMQYQKNKSNQLENRNLQLKNMLQYQFLLKNQLMNIKKYLKKLNL